jgi:DNA-binding NarL/FixJ family response regulator
MLDLDGPRHVFGDASTPAQAIALIGQEHWDIVVLDISLGGASGLELLGAIRQLRPSLPVLVLSSSTR